ncbi:MAG: hypothetical protein IPN76_35180 [Saprospiraceae bacterium]|nr:hypothetical protein [Saprospiraceae bacterium]
MKLIQITDLHVASEGEFTHGVDVRQNFLDILQAVKSFAPTTSSSQETSPMTPPTRRFTAG